MQKYTGATALNHTNLAIVLPLHPFGLASSLFHRPSHKHIDWSFFYIFFSRNISKVAGSRASYFFQHEHQLFFMSFELHFLRLKTGCHFFVLPSLAFHPIQYTGAVWQFCVSKCGQFAMYLTVMQAGKAVSLAFQFICSLIISANWFSNRPSRQNARPNGCKVQ